MPLDNVYLFHKAGKTMQREKVPKSTVTKASEF